MIRAKKKNWARVRVQSTRASHESTETARRRQEKKKEKEQERKRGALVSSSRVEAPGRFSATRVSQQRELVRSLQNTEKCMSHLELPQASFFHRRSFSFLKSKHI